MPRIDGGAGGSCETVERAALAPGPAGDQGPEQEDRAAGHRPEREVGSKVKLKGTGKRREVRVRAYFAGTPGIAPIGR